MNNTEVQTAARDSKNTALGTWVSKLPRPMHYALMTLGLSSITEPSSLADVPQRNPELSHLTSSRIITEEQARGHSRLFLIAASENTLRRIPRSDALTEFDVLGVRYIFESHDSSRCTVVTPHGIRYRLTGLNWQGFPAPRAAPSKDTAITHSKLLRDSIANHKLVQISCSDTTRVFEVDMVLFVFEKGASSNCTVYSEHYHPYQLKGLGKLRLPLESAQKVKQECAVSKSPPPQKGIVSASGHGQNTTGTPDTTNTDTRQTGTTGAVVHESARSSDSQPHTVQTQITISKDYNLAEFHADITAEQLNRILGGVLKDKGQTCIDAAKKNGICPLAFTAICLHESSNGRSDLARQQHNVFGNYDSVAETYMAFNSVEECIVFTAKRLAGPLYISASPPNKTVAEIHPVYCPEGALNDPFEKNKHWAAGVVTWMKLLNGGELATRASESAGTHVASR